MYSWNPVFNLIMEIKNEYIQTFEELDTYNFETWLNKLNNNKYNDIFESLQVNQNKNVILIRYGLAEMQRCMWEDRNSIYRECRSLVIDLENEEIILSPFRKFFNLNEVDENQLENIIANYKNAKVIEFSNKLDGSMQNARWYNGEIFMTGSMALNPNDSWRLEEGYRMLNNDYINMIKNNHNYTFIFEYISLKDVHVVLYNKKDEGLYLIGIRDTTTGEQLSYKNVITLAKQYNVKHVELEDKTIDDVLHEMKILESDKKEGWVLNIDGHMIKIKCDDYVNIHRILDKVSSPNVIIESIAENNFDDLIAKIPDKYKQRVNLIAELIFKYVNDTNKLIKKYYNESPKGNRKEFMIWVNDNTPQNIQPYVRNMYLNREYSILKKGSNGYKKSSDLGIDKEHSASFADLEEVI